MTQTNFLRRAFLGSIVALVLCLSMLIGITFAWFTDSVSSDNNQIIAGNLDVELYHTNKIDIEEKVASDTVLFDDLALWEPNAMVFEKLKVANEGDLALIYKLTLNALNATEVGGVSFASMLKVAVIEDAEYTYDRDAIMSDADLVWNSLATFSLEGELEAGKNAIYGIVIWWQPTADDNIFNMNNANKGNKVSVDIGVQLVATQNDVEGDSFDATFDKDVAFPNISVPAKLPAENVTESVALNAGGMNVEIPAAVINALPDTVTSVALAYTAPVVDAVNKTVTFEAVDLVDQNGKKIDLAGNTENIDVTLPAQEEFAAGEMVFVYHDGEFVAMATVNADGTISYSAAHFCEVVVSKDCAGKTVEVSTAEELIAVLGGGGNATLTADISVSDTIFMDGGILDGNNHTLTMINNDWSYKVLLNPTGGTIKNITLTSTNTFYIGSDYAIGSIQFASTTLTKDLYVENVRTPYMNLSIDLDANGYGVYVSDSDIYNFVQIANAKISQFEDCHFLADEVSKTSNSAKQGIHFLMGDMTYVRCHFEEDVNFYLDSARFSGTVCFEQSTYGNNGVEDRPIESFGFIKYWFPAFGIYGYAGTFGDTKPAQTHFNWYIDGVLVWDATAV